jgi:hypothetical protein
VISLTFACDGAKGRERLKECSTTKILHLDGYGAAILPDAIKTLIEQGWTFRRFGERFIVRCPKCEALRVSRNAARARRDTMREARKR